MLMSVTLLRIEAWHYSHIFASFVSYLAASQWKLCVSGRTDECLCSTTGNGNKSEGREEADSPGTWPCIVPPAFEPRTCCTPLWLLTRRPDDHLYHHKFLDRALCLWQWKSPTLIRRVVVYLTTPSESNTQHTLARDGQTVICGCVTILLRLVTL